MPKDSSPSERRTSDQRPVRSKSSRWAIVKPPSAMAPEPTLLGVSGASGVEPQLPCPAVTRTRTVLLVSLASLAVAASAHGGATAAPATARLCAAISGPRWTMHAGIATVAGGRYQIGVLNVACAKATKYVKQFYVRRSGVTEAAHGGARGLQVPLGHHQEPTGLCRNLQAHPQRLDDRGVRLEPQARL